MSVPYASPDFDPRRSLRERRRRLLEIAPRSPAAHEIKSLLAQVDAALARLDHGSYGLCETCHDPIEPGLLCCDPLVRFCIDHLDNLERRRLEQDIELAARVQTALLPRRDLQVDGWEVAYRFQPMGPVGGDYCDALVDRESGRLAFFMGDVSGKGIAASLRMTQLSAIVRLLAGQPLAISELLSRVNRAFCENAPESSYATLAAGVTGPDGTVSLANAGHCPPLFVHDGQVTALPATGLPVGLFCSSEYGGIDVRLGAGDLLVLSTDGIVEARNEAGEEFGNARLQSLVRRHAALDPAEMVDSCLAEFESFRAGAPREDDVTLMVIRRKR